MSRPIPTPRQLEFQDWEFGLFLHFGIRTFYEGHKDWDGKPMAPSAFVPSELDCGQWVDTAQRAGAKYMVLTAKHHDGFANWPSKMTDFSVSSSPWKGGEGDVVKEFADACHERGMKMGLYYSPADASCPVYDDPKAYDDYFINQISEILTPYGEVDLLWFDGCGSEGHEYDWQRIIGEVRRMQPKILIFNMGDPDYRWVGNEAGLANRPNWNAVDSVDFSIRTDEKENLGADAGVWLPAECDCMIRDHNWFYQDYDVDTVKSVEELVGLYYYSIGRGANLLLNIGPDRRGLLPEPDASRLLAFGEEIRKRFADPIAGMDAFSREENCFGWSNSDPVLIDHAILQEDLSDGERVRAFHIEVTPYPNGKPIVIYEGRNIGHKAICAFPPVRTTGVRVVVDEADREVALRSLSLHHTGVL